MGRLHPLNTDASQFYAAFEYNSEYTRPVHQQFRIAHAEAPVINAGNFFDRESYPFESYLPPAADEDVVRQSAVDKEHPHGIACAYRKQRERQNNVERGKHGGVVFIALHFKHFGDYQEHRA